MMRTKCALNFFGGLKNLRVAHNGPWHLCVLFYHQVQAPHKEILTPEMAFQKLSKMTQVLKNVDMIDGKLLNVEDDSVVMDDRIKRRIKSFKSLARLYLGSPSVQESLKKAAIGSLPDTESIPKSCFGQPNEREPMTLNTLTKVCNYLNISAQQRKSVRITICPQVTQHRIWAGTLEEILMGLKSEVESLYHQSSSRRELGLSEQIISSCLKFLSDGAISSTNQESTSWMRLAPTKKYDSPPSRCWEDLLDMFNDIFKCLGNEKELLYHMSKLEAMKEGMYHIRDVLVDKDIGYKEARHQERLVQKRLTKTLGHSSQCLFTLLQYYLYGSVRDPEIEVCGSVYKRGDKGGHCLCIGKILTSDDEKMVWAGVKQLDKALGLFKFVWEAAEKKEVLELQGHLWCVGVEDRILNYRGNVFFLHGIRR